MQRKLPAGSHRSHPGSTPATKTLPCKPNTKTIILGRCKVFHWNTDNVGNNDICWGFSTSRHSPANNLLLGKVIYEQLRQRWGLVK